jgi:hypothetical protein
LQGPPICHEIEAGTRVTTAENTRSASGNYVTCQCLTHGLCLPKDPILSEPSNLVAPHHADVPRIAHLTPRNNQFPSPIASFGETKHAISPLFKQFRGVAKASYLPTSSAPERTGLLDIDIDWPILQPGLETHLRYSLSQ